MNLDVTFTNRGAQAVGCASEVFTTLPWLTLILQ